MKNDYEVRGDVTVIFLKRKDGSVLEGFIDTEDFSKVDSYQGTWCCWWCKTTKSFYVLGNKWEAPKHYAIYLHRFIMDAPKGMCVDHMNFDTLDNRKSNLRVVTRAQNNQNFKGANANNSSGRRGVSYRKDTGKWNARVNVNGQQHNLGSYSTPEEAEAVVIAFRAKHMPYSQDAKHS